MKKILYTLVAALILCSCSLHEKTGTEIHPRPALSVGYAYRNDQGENTYCREVDWLDIFIFGPDGKLFRSGREGCPAGAPTSSLTLLDGVPEGSYTVVTYANVAQSDISGMTVGISTPEDLRAALDTLRPYPSADRILHSIDRFAVRRGRTGVQPVELDKYYFVVDLTVLGASPFEDFAVSFTGAPAGIDYAGGALHGAALFKPYLETEAGGKRTGRFCIPRFGERNDVRMTLYRKENPIGQVSLNRLLSKAGEGTVDLKARDVEIPLTVTVSPSTVTVTVADWTAGAEQFPIIGK